MAIMQILFWGSGVLILYTYIGYLFLLWLLSQFRESRPITSSSASAKPKVTLLISAYNEGATIEGKIHNSLALTYPKDSLEIVVVSDGSTDNTCEVVSAYDSAGVVLRHYQGRIGKTECLNKAVPVAEGEIIVFSDANTMYAANTIEELVRYFEDSSVGFVTGSTRYVTSIGGEKAAVAESMSLYAKIQYMIKTLESRVGSCIGADGAVFAIRKVHYEKLAREDINDLVLPLKILKRGAVGKLASGVVCTEEAFGTPQGQFSRQVRIANRTIRALINNVDLLNPMKFGVIAFEILSGKILRMLTPIFMAILLVTNLGLLGQHELYVVTCVGQLLTYVMVWVMAKGFKARGVSRIFAIAHTFVMVNAAIAVAWFQYVRGETYTTWAPVRR